MAEYKPTNLFTLLPAGNWEREECDQILKELYPECPLTTIQQLEVPEYKALLLYAFSLSTNALPMVAKYLSLLPHLSQHNKVILEFNPSPVDSLLLVADGEKLITANHYHTVDFGSAIYYLMEALRQCQMNPKQTIVHLYGRISTEEGALLRKYVKDFEQCE